MKSGQFDPRLESIRGLAALMVAGTHALAVHPTHGWAAPWTVTLRTLLNGDSAVTMFFILSGLVLGMGLQRQGSGTVREFCAYALRRAFRIYPVLVLSTAAILLFILSGRTWAGPQFWFNHVLDYRPSVLNTDMFPNGKVITANLFLLSASLNLVTWTLGVEMFCSLLLPLAHYARVRLPASGTWMLLAGAGFLAFLGKWFLLLGWVKLEGAFPWEVLSYFYLFYLGYLLPVLGPPLFARLRFSRIMSGVVLAAALALPLVVERFAGARTIVTGLSAWVVLGVVLYGFELKVFRCLEWPVVRFFGRVSYSFYLLHDLVLLCVARIGAHYLFQGRAPEHPFLVNLILLVVSILLAAVVATAAHRWIEVPFIQIGKRLTGRMTSPRKSVEPQPPIGVSATANVSA